MGLFIVIFPLAIALCLKYYVSGNSFLDVYIWKSLSWTIDEITEFLIKMLQIRDKKIPNKKTMLDCNNLGSKY